MGRKLPLLTPREVVRSLINLGFSLKRQVGSHAQYDRPADKTRTRALVTVDMGKKQFSKELMKSMIRQSGFTAEEFCSGAPNQKTEPQAPTQENPKKAGS